MPNDLAIIIPVFNEDPATVATTIGRLLELKFGAILVSLIVVDDNSAEELVLPNLIGENRVSIIRNKFTLGYGGSLKVGISETDSEWIGIVDADGTYEVERFPELWQARGQYHMVIATRTGAINMTPLQRRIPKLFLNLAASYFSGRRIRDLNSGMRIFRRTLVENYWGFLPNRFSFTSTLTLCCLMDGKKYAEVSTSYFRRVGKSSLRPIRDTTMFFVTVFRMGLVFAPLKLFGPVAVLIFILGLVKGLLFDYRHEGTVGVLAAVILLSSLQIFMMGLLAQLIVYSRFSKNNSFYK